MHQLLIIEGEDQGSLFTVRDGVRVGRTGTCEIQLAHKKVSRIHAQFEVEDGTVMIRDMESRNGVYVNGEQVTETSLSSGDEIKIGSTVFLFDPGCEVRVNRDGETLYIFDDEFEDHGIQLRPAGEGKDDENVTSDHDRLKTLYRITRALVGYDEQKEMLEALLRETVSGLRGDRGAVLLRDRPETPPSMAASWTRDEVGEQMSMSQTVIDEVLENRHSIRCPDASTDPRFESSVSLEVEQVQTFLATPLLRDDDLLGMIYVDSLDVMRDFEEQDLSLLENVAEQASIALADVQAYQQTREEVKRLRKRVSDQVTIVGDSPAINEVMETVEKVAPSSSTVLITGETGTGKELLARAIHHRSARTDGPFTAVDCSTISEKLIESELFGHVKGAFTGAEEDREGKFEAADGGTLFLDEIANLDLKTQKKLLRFIEERSFTRVGDVKLIEVDVRIIAATNRDLTELIDEGAFREDLYYRLNVVPIDLPPLRERREDIPALVDYFLERHAERNAVQKPEIEDDVVEALRERDWKGNIRELRNVVERMLVLNEGDQITFSDLPQEGRPPAAASDEKVVVEGEGSLKQSIRDLEAKRIRSALAETEGKKVDAAEKLDISRPTLDKKIEEYDIELPADDHGEIEKDE